MHVFYLSVLQWMNLGVKGRADDFIVSGVGRRSCPWIDVEPRQALGVSDCVVLPRFKSHAIERTLQDPITCGQKH